jgi:hypothetical protein
MEQAIDTTSTTTPTPAPQTLPDASAPADSTRTNFDNLNDGFEYAPLFGGEDVSEAALMGQADDTAEKTADAEPKVESKPDEKPKEEAKAEDKKPEEEAKDKEPPKEKEPDKPPPGYVPQAALHQERQANKNLKAEVQRLSAELAKATTAPVEAKESDAFKDFKVLNDAEFEQLLEEDPDGATRYQYKFTKYRDHQSKVQARQMAEQNATRARTAMITEAAAHINEMLPGIHEGKNETVPALVDFAQSNGVHPEWLQLLTDPRTEVITHDGKSLLLGNGAVQVVHLVKSAFEKVSRTPNEAQIRSKIEAELRPKIEAELQQTLMSKLQADPESFRSIDQIAGTGKKDSQPRMGVPSESEWARMSPAEQERMLGGR